MLVETTLPEICSLVTDGTHDSPKLQDSGVPFIKGKHISSGKIDFETCDYITEEDHEKCIKRVKPQVNDVLFSNIGSVGDVALVKSEVEFSIKNVALFRPNPDLIDSKYFYYLVISPLFKGSLLNFRSGAAQPFITLENFRLHKFLCHTDKVSQKKIGEILSAYDDLIENNLKRIRLLEESARLLYREWFIRLKFPNHEHTPLIDGLPEGWKGLAVPEFIDVNPRTPIDKEKEKCFVEMANLANDSMVVSASQRRTGNSGSRFQNGDTLFARITPCLENGKTGFVNFLEEGEVAFGSTEFIVLRPKTVPPEFVYCLSRTYHFRENAIKNMVGSSGRQRVKTSCFDEFFVAMPPQKILDEFESIAKPCFRQIRNLQIQNRNLKQARDLLLPRLMSGEIAV